MNREVDKQQDQNLCYNSDHSNSIAPTTSNPQVAALVRFIARCAAENDYKELARALNNESNAQENES